MAENISYIPNNPFVPVEGLGANKTASSKKTVQNGPSFSDLLSEKIADKGQVSFSGHAQARMRSRNISFSESQMQRINSAVDRARQKGAKDSLLMVDDVAAVVSVANNKVITVVDEAGLKENVFTNIDSAVIA